MKTSKLLKINALAVAMLVQFAPVSAQTGSHHKDIRGFVGLNFGNVSADGTEITNINGWDHKHTYEGQVGYQAGLALTFGNHFYISPGVWWSTYTANKILVNKDTASAVDFKKETTINSISVPVRVGFRLMNPETENVFNVRVFGGFIGHHILSVDVKGDNEVPLDEDDFDNIMIGANAGIGVDILFLFCDIGYDLGLTQYEKVDHKTRHNSFFINLGAKFGF